VSGGPLGGTVGVRDDAESVESVLADATTALEANGDLRDSRPVFEAAYIEGERAAAGLVMATAALGLCGQWMPGHRGQVAASLLDARLAHALSFVDPRTTLALRLRIRAASEADYRSGENTRALAALDEARAAADPVALAEALSRAHQCLPGPEHGERRMALAGELVGAAARTGQRGHLLTGLLWLVTDLFLDGDPHAEGRLGELRGLLADRDHLAVGYVVRAIDVMLAIRSGRLAEAERLAKECLDAGAKAGDIDADGWYAAHLVAIRWYQGRLPELLPMLAELTSSPTLSAVDYSFIAARAVAAAQNGDYLLAVRAMAEVRGRHLADLPRCGTWLVTLYCMAEAAYLLGDVDAAAEVYELLLPFADRPAMASLGIACFGSVNLALGLALVTLGELDDGLEFLSGSLCRNLALGHLPAVNVGRLRFAETLDRRREPGDLAVAADLRSKAAELAARLGPEVAPPARRFAASCRRHGTNWRLELGPRSALIGHSVGMTHLAVLLANPGAEIAAIDLVAGVDGLGAGSGSGSGSGSGQAVLDRAAVRQYQDRLAQVREQADRLESAGDFAGAARARGEQDWLLKELGASTGLAGRRRTFADGAERARIAVGRSIRRALSSIETADAVIGAHLRTAIHTGAKCWYRPV
jgi:hypothetical protein